MIIWPVVVNLVILSVTGVPWELCTLTGIRIQQLKRITSSRLQRRNSWIQFPVFITNSATFQPKLLRQTWDNQSCDEFSFIYNMTSYSLVNIYRQIYSHAALIRLHQKHFFSCLGKDGGSMFLIHVSKRLSDSWLYMWVTIKLICEKFLRFLTILHYTSNYWVPGICLLFFYSERALFKIFLFLTGPKLVHTSPSSHLNIKN
jgi:hypothetical protein